MSRLGRYPIIAVVSAALLLLLSATACKQLTPEEEIIQARSKYEATLNSFIVMQVPLLVEAEDLTGADEGDQTTEPAATEEVEDVPLRQDILVDLTIRHESDLKMDGITVDLFMADADENEVANWKVWFDTSEVAGDTPGVQFAHTLEDVDYQPGYGFSADMRSSVSAADQADYQEFAGL